MRTLRSHKHLLAPSSCCIVAASRLWDLQHGSCIKVLQRDEAEMERASRNAWATLSYQSNCHPKLYAWPRGQTIDIMRRTSIAVNGTHEDLQPRATLAVPPTYKVEHPDSSYNRSFCFVVKVKGTAKLGAFTHSNNFLLYDVKALPALSC
jgi:hypothetical protein